MKEVSTIPHFLLPRAITAAFAVVLIPITVSSLTTTSISTPIPHLMTSKQNMLFDPRSATLLPPSLVSTPTEQTFRLYSVPLSNDITTQRASNTMNTRSSLGTDHSGSDGTSPTIIKTSDTKDRTQGIHPLLNWWNNGMKQVFAPVRRIITTQRLRSLTFAVVFMLSVLFTPSFNAWAAPSGGRMGGSFGGSSRQSHSSSRVIPSTRSSGYRTGGGYNRGYSSGAIYRPLPSVSVSPPVYAQPLRYGYGASPVVSSRGPNVVSLLSFGLVAAVGVNILKKGNPSTTATSLLGPGVTIAQISVALQVPDRDDPSNILSFLDCLSRTARTDSRVGVSNLVSQTTIELLRQKQSIISASTTSSHYNNNEDKEAQLDFNSRAIQERTKFDKETINKFGGVNYQDTNDTTSRGDKDKKKEFQATMAVVTIIVSIDGDSTTLPKIVTIADVEKALTQLASDVKVDNSLRSAEILWTPEDDNDILTERDIVADYPSLRRV